MDAILVAIKETIQAGIFGFLDMILWLLSIIVKVVLLPVDALFKILMPDFATMLSHFSNSLITLAGAPFSYFFNILPPITKTIIVFWLTLLISYYTILWTYRGIIMIPKVIHKIKFW